MTTHQPLRPILSYDKGVYMTPGSLLLALYPTWLHRAAGVPCGEPAQEPEQACLTTLANPPLRGE